MLFEMAALRLQNSDLNWPPVRRSWTRSAYLIDLVITRREAAGAGVFAGADYVLVAGVDPEGGVDVGALTAPPFVVAGGLMARRL